MCEINLEEHSPSEFLFKTILNISKRVKMSSALEQLKASGTIVVADSGEIEKVSEH